MLECSKFQVTFWEKQLEKIERREGRGEKRETEREREKRDYRNLILYFMLKCVILFL